MMLPRGLRPLPLIWNVSGSAGLSRLALAGMAMFALAGAVAVNGVRLEKQRRTDRTRVRDRM